MNDNEKFVFYDMINEKYLYTELTKELNEKIGDTIVIITKEEINNPIDDYFSEEMIQEAKKLYNI